jgi:hypothetical protein
MQKQLWSWNGSLRRTEAFLQMIQRKKSQKKGFGRCDDRKLVFSPDAPHWLPQHHRKMLKTCGCTKVKVTTRTLGENPKQLEGGDRNCRWSCTSRASGQICKMRGDRKKREIFRLPVSTFRGNSSLHF